MIMVVVNNAVVMLVLSVLGILAGLWVVRQGEVRRVAFVAFVGLRHRGSVRRHYLVRAG